ncbi:NAD(P)H-dependent oxidoreductase [Mucilaginibacter rubeus]|uniref:NAD(P)H-dependent oxidoreductase n=1 Tax=Mucilaginibacter rubeus TaxID=2027860 RepID=A0AAE6MKX4_9SPHI|nr:MULTISPECIES: NAD(P)H-dependent oxidoreductase [Mucilaginibacter]QEM07160.1 NAD(P)H-dependent oxidoreductase [Mucilaginibacter rubeus]QEM19614.1 NAD(P)H-dependent oxidoreductase [Mucilaginibacter gossypii]QTE43695.1 NAD(P)H-dependent oxidoreductase [Mucilaginibacter rubeus]QTE50295.1 NAD(P)H-dependent oxidoreductase [Mucilaginibacter rubeus]QTE55382.1 NAD(P)H-dependent oxidoreductase [Mucilaginibacter rubeus]
MSLIEDLKWRHAVKAYIPTKKVSKEVIDSIVEAARLAPTSSGLQPFKLLVVENQDLKNRLAEGSLNPDSMRDCSHVLVFAAWDRYSAERIDTVYDFTTEERGLPKGRFNDYTDFIKGVYLNETADENFAHTARQTYIALGLAIAQAAELRVDSTPAEGFDNKLVDEVLNLKELGLKSVLLMYVGYKDTDRDWLSSAKKVRVPKEDFVVEFN